MDFRGQLSEYIRQLNMTQRELAQATGISAATISRYLNGSRQPEHDSEAVAQLAAGLSRFAADSGLTEEDFRKALNETLQENIPADYDAFLANLNRLLETLHIRNSDLAKALSYDASHISKILSGARRPGHPAQFIENVAGVIARRATEADFGAIAALTGTEPENINTTAKLRDHLVRWLGSGTAQQPAEPISHFLEKLDEFDLNEYMKAIRFDEIRLPPSIPQLPISRTYYGLAEMMESELDFMKTTVLSRQTDDCILYSDMPLEEMAKDPEFPKKWMFGMGMMLKKGLHLHIIHDVNRPFPEMMLGLEGNIPMYMTGQISPYYLPVSQSTVFTHLLKVSGAAALEGSAIAGHQSEGKYVLYRSRDDVRHYRMRAEALLKKARPLMEIYRSDRKQMYQNILADTLAETASGADSLRMVCSSLPLFTIPEDLLRAMLSKTGLSGQVRTEILAYRESSLASMLALLPDCGIRLEIPAVSREQFDAAPLGLALADLFIETDIPYTYEEYSAHLQETIRFAAQNPGVVIEQNPAPAFHNISFTISGRRLVIVSKEKSPAIHFVIHHRMMVQAFLNFIPPIVEKGGTQ